jgi:hypothetical protein
MAQQLKKCVEDLTEAQKRIAAHDAVPCVCFFLLTFFLTEEGCVERPVSIIRARAIW